jgi:hypothetical protein
MRPEFHASGFVSILRTIGFAAAIWSFCAVPAHATTIQLTQTQPLRFGTMQIPSSGSETRIISTAGAGSGTGTYLFNTVQNGQYTICCSAQCGGSQYSGITINVTSPSIGTCTGMTSIGTFTGNYNGNAITFPSTQARTTIPACPTTVTLRVGATATYPSTVTETTTCSPTFNVTVLVNP